MNLFLRSTAMAAATLAAMSSSSSSSSLFVSAEEPEEDLIVATEQSFDVSSYYNNEETRGSFDMIMKPYEIPVETTTYIDFMINLPEDIPDLFHVVWGEVINTQPQHLHHFVLMGCKQKIDEDIEGTAVPTDLDSFGCFDQLGVWAPGANVFGNFDLDTGFLLGRGLGFEALRLNVHYTDGVYVDEALKSLKVATDGIRVHYTTDFRPYSSMRKQLINIFEGWDEAVTVPPNEKRWYMTRTCKVVTSCKDAAPEKMRLLGFMAGAMGLDTGMDASMFENLSCDMVGSFCNMGGELGAYLMQVCPATCGLCEEPEDGTANPLNPGKYRVAGVHYHAHLLGREMYTTLLRDEPEEELKATTDIQIQKQAPNLTTITTATDLESRDFWFYEDQAIIPFAFNIEKDDGEKLRGFELKPGDKVQTTCVYDSSWKDDPTRFDLATYDEMCIIAMRVTFETPASLLELQANESNPASDNGLELFTELRMMMFMCDDDEETHVHTGVLAEGEDGRDIWKNHPISLAKVEGCTYPVMDFLFIEAQTFIEGPQCPPEPVEEEEEDEEEPAEAVVVVVAPTTTETEEATEVGATDGSSSDEMPLETDMMESAASITSRTTLLTMLVALVAVINHGLY